MMRLYRLLKDTTLKWLADDAPQLGASLAFYSMLSLGPLLLLILSGASLLFGDEAARGQIMEQINGLVGEEAAATIQEVLASASHQKHGGILATIVGAVTLLLGASGVFGQLQQALNSIWGVQAKKGGGIWGMIKNRFFSFSMVIGCFFLLLVSLVVSAVLATIGEFSEDWLPASELVLQLINQGVGFAVITLLFAIIFRYVPDAHIQWRDVWPGAALTAALFTLGKLLIGLYLGHSAFSSTYGAAGSLVVLLVWVYYSAQIVFFGAEFTQVYTHRRGGKATPTKHATHTAR